MEKENEIPVRVVVRLILLDEEGRVLLARRAKGTVEEGKWCLVGGKPDSGETKLEAIKRETEEEIGLVFEPTFYREILNPDTSMGSRWNTFYFGGRVESKAVLGEIDTREISEIGFFSEEELAELDIALDHKEVILNFLKFNG